MTRALGRLVRSRGFRAVVFLGIWAEMLTLVDSRFGFHVWVDIPLGVAGASIASIVTFGPNGPRLGTRGRRGKAGPSVVTGLAESDQRIQPPAVGPID